MLINTEFGSFSPDSSKPIGSGGKRLLPRNAYDDIVDHHSQNPNKQVFEKLLSGHYLGEIVRVILLEFSQSGKLFCQAEWKGESGYTFGILEQPHSFDTSYMSRIERDHSSELVDTKSVLEDIFGIYRTTLDDRLLLKFICEIVAVRSARLAAAAIGGILAHLGVAILLCHMEKSKNAKKLIIGSDDNIIVAIDGSLFEHYPHYPNRMMDAFRELFGYRADSIHLNLACDGSGLGAALVACVATKDI
jgi:hexokinase